MEENKSIQVRVGPGKEDVLVPGFVKFSDQCGDLKCGKTLPVIKLTLFLNLIQLQKKSVTRSKKKGNRNRKGDEKTGEVQENK